MAVVRAGAGDGRASADPRFRLLTGRAPRLEARLATGRGALEVLDAHLTAATGSSATRDDRRPRAVPVRQRRRRRGLELARRQVARWLDRVRALPGFVDDFVTYPDNARRGRELDL